MSAADRPDPAALYVHVPFCASKCAYCDFTSEVRPSSDHVRFIDKAILEARSYRDAGVLGDVVSLYVGGGTPTLLGSGLYVLLDGLRRSVPIARGAEITVEANPDTTDPDVVRRACEGGANRFSLGVQSLDDDVLRILGRRHDADRALRAIGFLMDACARVSVDLICGVPGAPSDSWRETLEAIACTDIGHVSVYPLAIEDGTPFARAVADGTMRDTDPDLAAAEMSLADELLSAAGFSRYETASYARRDEFSRHNTAYWSGTPYLGVGPSAASMLPAITYARLAAHNGWPAPPVSAARVRFTNTSDVEAWLSAQEPAVPDAEFLDAREAVREDIMLGMRLTRGVDACVVERAGLYEVFESLVRDRLVERITGAQGASWRTTDSGWLLGNEVFGRIWNAD